MQTGLGRFGIGKSGPHNRPVSQALPSLPTFVPGNIVAKRKPGRPRKEVDSATAADLQKKQPARPQPTSSTSSGGVANHTLSPSNSC